MNDSMLPLPGLSSVSGKPVVVKFDGGLLSSDGGILALREVEQRLRVADQLAACIVDPRAPDQITHSLAEIIRFRLLMISAGYEDGNDANSLRPFQGVPRRREKLEPRRADHRPRRSWRGRARHPFRRHQSERTQRPRALRGCLLPARPGRKSYQIMEDPSGGRSHFLACRRVLVDVGASGVNAETFDVARRPVRHIAPAPDQDRRTGRRDEDDDPGALAHVMPRAGCFALHSRTHTAPRHLKDGACATPNFRTRPVNPQTLSAPNPGSKPQTRRVRTHAKSNEITRARRRPMRNCQSAALSGLGADVSDDAGSIKEVKGAAKEAIGKAIGDAKLQSDGKTDAHSGHSRRLRERVVVSST